MSSKNDDSKRVNRVSAPRKLLNRFRRGVSQLTPARDNRTSTTQAASQSLPHSERTIPSASGNRGNGRASDMRDLGRIRLASYSYGSNDERIGSSMLKLLPATAEVLGGDDLKKFTWKGVLEVLLAGTRDANSALAPLREHETTIVREIYSYIGNQWAGHVKLTIPAALVGRCADSDHCYLMRFNQGRHYPNFRHHEKIQCIEDDKATPSGFDDGFVAFAACGHVYFPEPAARNVNMMPFIFGDRASLPGYLQCYYPLIDQCPYMQDYEGKVGYLTVHESYVDVGDAQRREGLHIESPGIFCGDTTVSSFTPGEEHGWGRGIFWGPDKYEGGIFMASSVADTSEVWDALVDSRTPGIVDQHGGCEHLRSLIGRGTKLQAGELVWMTDMTPHEALPQDESGYRQFFRVVTPCVSHWYVDHSTENPMVPLPSNVTAVRGNKFVQSMSEVEA